MNKASPRHDKHLGLLAKHLHRPSEFQQLYISTTLYFFALSLIIVFVPIYLFELGYNLAQIAGYYVIVKVAHLLISLPAAQLANFLGVKHSLVISYALFFIQTIILLGVAGSPWLIPVAAVVAGIATANFSTANFSCMSCLGSHNHLGHDLALLNRWRSIATALGVLSGGLISQIFSVPLTLTIVASLIILSTIPLMLSPEPIKHNQSLNLRRFPWKLIKWDFISIAAIKICNATTKDVWTLFLALFVFIGAPYAGVGLITSLAFAASIVIAYFFGQMIDHGHGQRLLRAMVPVFSISYLMRVFIGSPVIAYGFNFAAQIPEIGVNLSYGQGMISRGQEIGRYQLIYFALMEIIYAIASLIIWAAIWLIAWQGHDRLSFQVIFIVATVLAFLILSERFPSLRSSSKSPKA